MFIISSICLVFSPVNYDLTKQCFLKIRYSSFPLPISIPCWLGTLWSANFTSIWICVVWPWFQWFFFLVRMLTFFNFIKFACKQIDDYNLHASKQTAICNGYNSALTNWCFHPFCFFCLGCTAFYWFIR